jgi:hypothetical protein
LLAAGAALLFLALESGGVPVYIAPVDMSAPEVKTPGFLLNPMLSAIFTGHRSQS